MPSLSLDDFGALVAASLDGPTLPLDLHMPAGLQRGLSRSRSRPSLPTLFRRPSPLNLPLALSPASDAQPAAFSPRSFQSSLHRNEASLPDTFTLPRMMGQSPLPVSPPSISSPISATYTFESSAFGSPPRVPPTPPSRNSQSSSNPSRAHSDELMPPPPPPSAFTRRASAQSSSTSRSTFSGRLRALPFSSSITSLVGRAQRSPGASLPPTSPPDLHETWPEPRRGLRSPPPSPPRRASKLAGLLSLGRSGDNAPSGPISRAPSPAPRRSTSVPALRALVRIASRAQTPDIDADPDPAEISRVFTPDADPFAKREVDIVHTSPTRRGGGVEFSNPFASGTPVLRTPSALGLYDAVDPLCVTGMAVVIPPTPSPTHAARRDVSGPKFTHGRQLFVPGPPSPQRRGSAPLVGGSIPPTPAADPRRRGSVASTIGFPRTREEEPRTRPSTALGERKPGLRERLGSAFRLGLGRVHKEREDRLAPHARESSPAPSASSSFASRDAHAAARSAFVTPMPSPRSTGRFPFAEPGARLSFVTPVLLEPPPLERTPMPPRRMSTVELPLDTKCRSRYGATLCTLSPDRDPTAQLLELVARTGGLTPPPDVRRSDTDSLARVAEARQMLPRKDELYAPERKGSFPFQASRQRSLGELDLLFSPEDSDGDGGDWRRGARERWERASIESSVGVGSSTDISADVDTDPPVFVDPWTTSEDEEGCSIWSWPMPPAEVLKAPTLDAPMRVTTPPPPLRRSVSFDSPPAARRLGVQLDRRSCHSAYFSAHSRPSTACTDGGRDKPLPPAPTEDEQDDSGVFVGEISVTPLMG